MLTTPEYDRQTTNYNKFATKGNQTLARNDWLVVNNYEMILETKSLILKLCY